MEIDVISFTDEQYAKLTDEQLIQVQQVQQQKNRLLRALEKAKAKEKYKAQLIEKNGDDYFKAMFYYQVTVNAIKGYANIVEIGE